ncbi:carbohydrate ABC transporter permease [Paenibacillus harenae]|uniref:Multiple sugar transport system permease protein n=1 Tax=Paenibacillus harenae TaxID=306543 RepID=A0ABT9TZ06_PAEHA|nr:carbohydrate ABC transporter permease [Paenibacillus harenae]MDQ0112621.1 multiple sugar transport system permease protein [Paenibacillus harenae]
MTNAMRKSMTAMKLAFLILIALAMLFPVVLTVSNSFMSEEEIGRHYGLLDGGDTAAAGKNVMIRLIPETVTLSQFGEVLLKRPKFLLHFWNSVKLTLPIIAGQAIIGTLAGFAFAKLAFPGRDRLFFVYLLTMLMPFQVTLVPNYLVADKLGFLNSYGAIILPGLFASFGVFLMRQFMASIPDAYLEAIRIDGAGHLRAFIHIALPLAKPGIAALVLLSFVDNWNMVEQPILFLSEPFRQPLSVYLATIAEGARGVAFAASVLYMTPMVLIFLYGEEHLVEGIQMSGIKG